MGLSQEVTRGELGRWFAARMPGTAEVAGEVAAAAASAAGRAGVVRPPRDQRLGQRHWAEVGGVFGMRMAAVVEQAPPYYGLYGLVAAGLLSVDIAQRVAGSFPSHRDLSPTTRAWALDMRPSPSGWLELAQPQHDTGGRGWADEAVVELVERTGRYHDEHAPLGTIGGGGAERGLARVYGWWSAAEDIYRSGIISDELDELLGADAPTADMLRELTAAAVVADTAALAARLRTSGSLDALHEVAGNPAAGSPLGCAGPVFVPHWADGDLLVGDTLIDVKTVLRADDPGKAGSWLWQVLAYAWLDSRSDHYRIRAVGLYLSRHGVLLRWPVDALAARLLATRRPGAPGSARCARSSSPSPRPRPPATAPRSRCTAATVTPDLRPCPARLSGWSGGLCWSLGVVGPVPAGRRAGWPAGRWRGGRLVGWWSSALWTWRVSSGARHEWTARRSAERAGASGR